MKPEFTKEHMEHLAKMFYHIIYGHGTTIPRISVKWRLQHEFGDEYFEKDYIENLLKEKP